MKNPCAFISTLLLLSITPFLSGCPQPKDNIPEIKGMVYIPAGKFIMGSNDVDNLNLAKEFGAREKMFFENEKPVRIIYLKGFYIDKYEVTNKEYSLLITKARYSPPPPQWKDKISLQLRENHPVFNVNWFDAEAYCAWRGKRLPTEEEWEKAARGPRGNRYPWGDTFDEEKGNLNLKDTVPVGTIPEDKSYYGVYDMGGNLMEWTSSWYKPYPGSTFPSKDYGEKFRVVRGSTGNIVGHYHITKIFSRSSYRHTQLSNAKTIDLGFRCVKDRE